MAGLLSLLHGSSATAYMVFLIVLLQLYSVACSIAPTIEYPAVLPPFQWFV